MLFSTNSIAAKALLSLLALGLAGGAGVGIKKLRDHAQEVEKEKDAASAKKRIELPDIYRWLEAGKEESKDNDKWTEKLKDYKAKQATSDVLLLGEKNDINEMKTACLNFRGQEFEIDVFKEKSEWVVNWCSTKKTVKEYLSGLKDKFLSFEDNNDKDKNEWEKKFTEYKEKRNNSQNQKYLEINDWNDQQKEESIKKMKAKCKELQTKEIDNNQENVTVFKSWCVKK